MPKADKTPRPRIVKPQEAAYLMMAWSCNHHPAFSEIVAYVPITGEFEIIADIHGTKGVDAEVVAGLIVRAVNDYEKARDMIAQMIAALELCLACDECLTWEAEHDTRIVLERAREMLPGV